VTPAVLGFVGLGNIGGPMAANLAAAGFALVCFDAAGTTERLPPGASAAEDPAAVTAGVDTVMLSLPDGRVCLDVARAIAAATPRRATTVIDLSTVGPAAAAEAASVLAPAGVTYVDGPVSGGVAGARNATVSLMYAGPVETLEAHREVFGAIAGNVFNSGTTPGQGQALKLLNNYLSATALAASSEALAFGRAHGLDMKVMLDAVNASSGRNTATADKFPNRVMTGTYDAGFHTALMAKDMRLYVDMARQVGTSDTVGRVVSAVWQEADAAMPGSDFTRIWPFVSGADRGVR
jgi:3-hydroxyisobutyrate dehydrogenase-like beta-hydroxyacid dehydrogenase